MNSRQENMERIKKEDKKPKWIMIVIMIASGLIGGICGYAASHFDIYRMTEGGLTFLKEIVGNLSLYAGFTTSSITLVISIVLYRKCRRLQSQWDEEDDTVLSQIEKRLHIAGMLVNGNLLVTYIFMLTGFDYIFGHEDIKQFPVWKLVIFFMGLVMSIAIGLKGTSVMINFQKELNPEKRGSAFEFNFQKKWMDSSDEAEKLLTYKACFTAYKATSMACYILWLVSGMCVIMLEWEPWPGIVAGIIWFVNYFSANIAEYRLERYAHREKADN